MICVTFESVGYSGPDWVWRPLTNLPIFQQSKLGIIGRLLQMELAEVKCLKYFSEWVGETPSCSATPVGWSNPAYFNALFNHLWTLLKCRFMSSSSVVQLRNQHLHVFISGRFWGGQPVGYSLRNAWSVNAFLYHGHLFYLNDGVCGKGESAKATYLTLE